MNPMADGFPSRALVVVPTYNEVDNVGDLLGAILKAVPSADVLVVDDSSPDGTELVISRWMKNDTRVNLLVRPRREGLAAAYAAGFEWGLDRGYGALVEMDGDFSHDPNDLPRILEELKRCDVVVGCRYMGGGGTADWSWFREMISRGGNAYARRVLRLPYCDLTGGFNAWRREVLDRIQASTSVRSKGYAFQVELKYRAHKAGFCIRELPIVFKNRRAGKSKMSSNIIFEAARRVLEMRRECPAS